MAPHSDVRQLRRSVGGPHYQPLDWDSSLPYGGKVYLARRKKPDTWLCIFLEVSDRVTGLVKGVWCRLRWGLCVTGDLNAFAG